MNHTSPQYRINGSDTIEVFVNSASVYKFFFGILQNMKDKLVTSIESFTQAEVPATPINHTVVDAAGFGRAFLTLCDKTGKELITKLPLYSLSSNNNNGVVKQFDFLKVDWEKSFIEIGDQATPAPANQSYLFTVGHVPVQDKAQLLYEQQKIKEAIERIDKHHAKRS